MKLNLPVFVNQRSFVPLQIIDQTEALEGAIKTKMPNISEYRKNVWSIQ